MKGLLFVLLLLASTVFAADTGSRNTGAMGEDAFGNLVPGSAVDPSLTLLVGDNLSHTVGLRKESGGANDADTLWFRLWYNGSGTCIVRTMGSTTKASYPALPVATGSYYSTVVNRNARFVNYSGCAGTTTTSIGTGNSIVERQGK